MTKIASGAALGYISLPLLQSCEPTSMPLQTEPTGVPIGPDGTVTVDVSSLSAANPALVAQNVQGQDGFGVIVTLTSDGNIHAFSMKCTHQGCSVDNQLAHDEIHCSCHNSLYYLDGTVAQAAVSGQPPLASYPVTKYDPVGHIATIKII